MNIVITGALGHIGSFLLRSLPSEFENINIIAIDSLVTQRYFSLFNLPKNGKFRFIEADITEVDVSSILNDVDYVIHLAAITDATSSFKMKKLVEQNNYNSTNAALNLCVKKNAKLIIMSSASVYGTQKSKVDENCLETELKPQSPYAEVKLKEENLVRDFSYKNNLKTIILRLGTIYGVSPGMRFHTAVNKFCWQAVMKTPLTIWETALNQKRPYLDLIDLANSIVYIIKNDLFNNDIYNILTNNLTVNQIINYIKEFEPELKIKFVRTKIMNQLSYQVLNEKFSNLGFQFTGDIKLGIKKTILLLKQSNSS